MDQERGCRVEETRNERTGIEVPRKRIGRPRRDGGAGDLEESVAAPKADDRALDIETPTPFDTMMWRARPDPGRNHEPGGDGLNGAENLTNEPTFPRCLLKLGPMVAQDRASGNVETSFWLYGMENPGWRQWSTASTERIIVDAQPRIRPAWARRTDPMDESPHAGRSTPSPHS